MRPSSLGGGRILRRTLSVRLSVCPSVPLSLPSVTSFRQPLASRMYFSARTEGRVSYGHLGRTDSCFSMKKGVKWRRVRRAKNDAQWHGGIVSCYCLYWGGGHCDREHNARRHYVRLPLPRSHSQLLLQQVLIILELTAKLLIQDEERGIRGTWFCMTVTENAQNCRLLSTTLADFATVNSRLVRKTTKLYLAPFYLWQCRRRRSVSIVTYPYDVMITSNVAQPLGLWRCGES